MSDKDPKSEKSFEKMTPEERLFKVIATGGRDLSSDEDSKQGKDPTELGDLSEIDPFMRFEQTLNKITDLFGHFFHPFRKGAAPSRQAPAKTAQGLAEKSWSDYFHQVVHLKTLNSILLGVVILLAVYLVVDFIFGKRYHSSQDMEAMESSRIIDAAGEMRQLPDVSQYLNPASSRNMFMPPPPPPKEVPAEPGSLALGSVAVPTNLKLVGISWDDMEFVAMVEYEGEKGARFVRKGDNLNGIQVENITEFSVSLSQGGQAWELR